MRKTITVSLSTKPFDHKPDRDTEAGKIRFKRREVTIDDFIQSVTNGYAFTSLFKDNWRHGDNYECTSLIVYDIDHSDTEMFEYIDRLSIKPTFAYTSSSNKIDDYRHRLVYILDDEMICSLNEYTLLSKSFAYQLNLSFVDTRSYQGEQMWYGSMNAQVFRSDTLIRKSDITVDASVAVELIGGKQTKEQGGSVKPYIHTHTLGVSEPLTDDFESMSSKEFLDKYESTYYDIAKVEHSDLELDEDTPIVQYPEDYYEIRRKFCKNGDEVKLKDGDRRRRSIFLNLLIRKLIFLKNHDQVLSKEQLLYCAVHELYHHIINSSDDPITKKDLATITHNVYNTDVNDPKYSTLGKPKYKRMVNPLYCAKRNLSKKQVMGMSRNKKQYIGEFYDPSLTVNENIKVMREYGLEVSRSTLKRWMKEHGIHRE